MCECYADELRKEIARQEDEKNNSKLCLYWCLQCEYEVHAPEGRHYCPMCSTERNWVPLAKIAEA